LPQVVAAADFFKRWAPERRKVAMRKLNVALHNNKALLHLFPIPALLIYSIFIVYPIFAAFTYSLFEWKGLTMGAFNYFDNFAQLFNGDPYRKMFWNALQHNVIYFVVEMIVQNGIAFALAYIIFTKVKGAQFFKMAFFIPRLLSIIVIGFLWKLILNPNSGLLNVLLKKVGLDSWAQPWLGDPKYALIAVILVNCWFAIGFMMLIFLAGLQSMSHEVLEAATLDGAKGTKMLRFIILPMMVQPIIIVMVLTFIQAFEAFELVFAMQGSQGEPFYSTDTLAVFFYRTAFGGSSAETGVLGVGSALAVVMFFIIATISAVFMYSINKKGMD
jgi:raffinose/stachyose/melibiose transport system permease protein